MTSCDWLTDDGGTHGVCFFTQDTVSLCDFNVFVMFFNRYFYFLLLTFLLLVFLSCRKPTNHWARLGWLGLPRCCHDDRTIVYL